MIPSERIVVAVSIEGFNDSNGSATVVEEIVAGQVWSITQAAAEKAVMLAVNDWWARRKEQR